VETECFDKPVWTLSTLAREVRDLPPHLARVACTAAGRPISNALRERIMLAVAAENRCPYCQLAHGAIGQSAGLTEAEVASILAGRDDPSVGDPAERTALAFARDLARRDFAGRDEHLWGAMAEHYTDEQRAAIESSARVMNFANRFGNTFDATRERITGRCEDTAAGGLDMAVLSSLFVAVAAAVAPAIGLLLLKQRAL
jgi:AhpD family alkylhydroperoxidase